MKEILDKDKCNWKYIQSKRVRLMDQQNEFKQTKSEPQYGHLIALNTKD